MFWFVLLPLLFLFYCSPPPLCNASGPEGITNKLVKVKIAPSKADGCLNMGTRTTGCLHVSQHPSELLRDVRTVLWARDARNGSGLSSTTYREGSLFAEQLGHVRLAPAFPQRCASKGHGCSKFKHLYRGITAFLNFSSLIPRVCATTVKKKKGTDLNFHLKPA